MTNSGAECGTRHGDGDEFGLPVQREGWETGDGAGEGERAVAVRRRRAILQVRLNSNARVRVGDW